MPVHSKPAEQATSTLLTQLLLGNNKRKMVSATIFLIIAFLLHIKYKKTDVESLKTAPPLKQGQKEGIHCDHSGRKGARRCHLLEKNKKARKDSHPLLAFPINW